MLLSFFYTLHVVCFSGRVSAEGLVSSGPAPVHGHEFETMEGRSGHSIAAANSNNNNNNAGYYPVSVCVCVCVCVVYVCMCVWCVHVLTCRSCMSDTLHLSGKMYICSMISFHLEDRGNLPVAYSLL